LAELAAVAGAVAAAVAAAAVVAAGFAVAGSGTGAPAETQAWGGKSVVGVGNCRLDEVGYDWPDGKRH